MEGRVFFARGRGEGVADGVGEGVGWFFSFFLAWGFFLSACVRAWLGWGGREGGWKGVGGGLGTGIEGG